MKVCNDGLSEEVRQKIQSVFQKYPDIDRALLYGSRAKGTFKPGSDIDLALVGPSLTVSILLRVENDLEDLLLPYKIDLSLYESIDNDSLREHIQRVGVVFYSRQK